MSSIKLKPYQQQILDELEYLPSVALFMGTGSGKTYTSLFKTRSNPTSNLLVICPARVVEQWQDNIPHVLSNYEVLKFPKRSTAIVKNTMIANINGSQNAVVVSLEVVSKLTNLKKIINKDWTIIVDESHKIKELGTARNPIKVTSAVLALGEKTPFKIILTATPTQKEFGGYIDYFTQLKFLGFMKITHSQFVDRYCKIHTIPMVPHPIKKIVGYRNVDEIEKLLSLVARRYVPKFTEGEPVFIKIPLDTCKSYPKLEKERFYKELNLQSLNAMRIARKTLTGGKITGRDVFGELLTYEDNTIKVDWLQEFLEDTEGSVLVFYKYNVERDAIVKMLQKENHSYLLVNGDTPFKRSKLDEKDYKVILGQINACGESVDGLQFKTHIAVYYSMPESSVEYTQSLGRIDRIGQENIPVYYHLVMKGTIDEDIYRMTQNKVFFNEEVLNKLNIQEVTNEK